jgi:hypothetical protein
MNGGMGGGAGNGGPTGGGAGMGAGSASRPAAPLGGFGSTSGLKVRPPAAR